MKVLFAILLIFIFSLKSNAKDWQQTVMIDQATCFYDENGPKIRLSVSPAIIIDKKSISNFIEAKNYDFCPRMNEISDRVYLTITLRVDTALVYNIDEKGICNLYEIKSLLMFVPLQEELKNINLMMQSSIQKTLKERNLSIGHCTGGF